MMQSNKADSVTLYKVRKTITELSSKEGRGTELVSLYIPPKKPIHEVISNLREEWGTAGNIKSDTTRNHVQDALVRSMQRLKLYKEAPPNGLVIFCGALPTGSGGPGTEVVQIWEIVPPKQITTYIYTCDDHFHIDQLKDMLKEEKVYGVLVIDSSEAGIGILSGDRLDIEDILTSGVSGKTRKGGQSARRYERLREMELTYFFNRVAEHLTRIMVDNYHVAGIIIGGPGTTKQDFVNGGYLHYQLQKNILAEIDSSYSGREGIREVVEKASDVLQGVRLVEEKKLIQRFLLETNRSNGLAIYGLPQIIQAMDRANVEMVLVSDSIDTTSITMKCKNCGTSKQKIVQNQKRMQTFQEMISTPCEKCGSTDYETDETDVIDVLEEKAALIGAKVEVVSSDTEDGKMLLSFGGIGAFLRYRQ